MTLSLQSEQLQNVQRCRWFAAVPYNLPTPLLQCMQTEPFAQFLRARRTTYGHGKNARAMSTRFHWRTSCDCSNCVKTSFLSRRQNLQELSCIMSGLRTRVFPRLRRRCEIAAANRAAKFCFASVSSGTLSVSAASATKSFSTAWRDAQGEDV